MAKIPSQSAASQPLLVQRPDGTWEFNGVTEEDHVDTFLKVDGDVDSAQWALAAIAASIDTRYGEDNIGDFAKKVKHTPRHIRRIAKTYRETMQKGRHRPNLTFSHHVEALAYENVEEALDAAEANDLSALGLRDWINKKAHERLDSKEKKERETSFQEFLERVESVILNDWLVTCPNQAWGRRIFNPVLDEIRWENRQLYMQGIKDKVKAAISKGSLTISDIKATTGLKAAEIESTVGSMVIDGELEWVREGGETEVARGTRRVILHVVGQPVFV